MAESRFDQATLSSSDISSIFGSISIACWLVVFLPQLIINFRRRSTDGLSVRFVGIWLSGDICNVLGGILQGVLPTMIILAVYYAFVDIILLAQCFYYRGFTLEDDKILNQSANGHKHQTALLRVREGIDESSHLLQVNHSHLEPISSTVSATHLSPAVPFVPEVKLTKKSRVTLQKVLLTLLAVLTVVSGGILSWYLTRSNTHEVPKEITFSPWGQTFGYFCAFLYLCSRLPQLLLNYRRKSTEGISMLFFLFACIGNLSLVLSIFIHEPYGGSAYWRYLGVNASWIIGSAGNIFLDLSIFTQFWIYGDAQVEGDVLQRKP